jgi:hypothetical protein
VGGIGQSGGALALQGRDLADNSEQLDAELIAVEQAGAVVALEEGE